VDKPESWGERHPLIAFPLMVVAFIAASRAAFWLFPWLTLDRAAPLLIAFGLGWAWGTRHKWWWSSDRPGRSQENRDSQDS
jgi:hypothetical protein